NNERIELGHRNMPTAADRLALLVAPGAAVITVRTVAPAGSGSGHTSATGSTGESSASPNQVLDDVQVSKIAETDRRRLQQRDCCGHLGENGFPPRTTFVSIQHPANPLRQAEKRSDGLGFIEGSEAFAIFGRQAPPPHRESRGNLLEPLEFELINLEPMARNIFQEGGYLTDLGRGLAAVAAHKNSQNLLISFE